MRWRKLGRIFCPEQNSDWMYSHAMLPIAEKIDGDLFRIYFSSRDKLNRGHGAYLEVDMRNPTQVSRLNTEPVFKPGTLGCFDDSGVLLNSIVNLKDRKLLFYTGINIGVTVNLRYSIGVAEWNEEAQMFVRLFEGPIIDRTKDFPYFVSSPEVHFENGRFRAWFTNCVKWVAKPGGPKHYYNIEYAESGDGVNWNRNGTVAIDFADPYEYAISIPRVLKDRDHYNMWFSSRATQNCPTYRIYRATSGDGIVWERQKWLPEIDVSESGWDSEMIEYPYIFDHEGQRYMLYNGNGYGKTGFGLAVLENG